MCRRFYCGGYVSKKISPENVTVELVEPGVVRVSETVVRKYGIEAIREINGGHCEIVVDKSQDREPYYDHGGDLYIDGDV